MGEMARKIIQRLAEEGGLFGRRVPAALRTKDTLSTPQMSKIDHDTSTDLLKTADILQEACGLAVDQITLHSTEVVRHPMYCISQYPVHGGSPTHSLTHALTHSPAHSLYQPHHLPTIHPPSVDVQAHMTCPACVYCTHFVPLPMHSLMHLPRHPFPPSANTPPPSRGSSGLTHSLTSHPGVW